MRVFHHENQDTPKSWFTSTCCLGLLYFENLSPPTPSALPGDTPSYDVVAVTLSLLEGHRTEVQMSLLTAVLRQLPQA